MDTSPTLAPAFISQCEISGLGAFDEALDYFRSCRPFDGEPAESDRWLYRIRDLLNFEGHPEYWPQEYERAIAEGVQPRAELQAAYQAQSITAFAQ